ncbi:MAG: alanine--tRNA ligase [Patescibacteria group bacterium]|jgi:alanyl-tRNA synthetase
MTAQDLRQKFISFFVSKGHREMPPASLIPENDPSVLFTTAGMQQFKKFYTHPEEAPAKNIVTCQSCLRTSDIEEVGDDTHLTFFEMLGNFSFGGYFKKEAIEWGYEFLVKELDINPKKLKCSIFGGDETNPRDDESAKILESINLKFEEHGREDCFWGPTGDEGPCGPCVEMFVDNIEVWTLVFNEYYQNTDGSYHKLATPGVDTGMGLERMLVVIKGEKDVYETDVFAPIIRKIESISGKKYQDYQTEFRIVADHLKAATFAINDGILPSNKDAGYIVRRLIRRAVIKARQIGLEKNFTYEIGERIFEVYKNNNLLVGEGNILDSIEIEEKKFRQTLEKGLERIEIASKIVSSQPKTQRNFMTISGMMTDLKQTYGFPLELSLEFLNRNNDFDDKEMNFIKVAVDEKEKRHQELSRTASAGMFKGGLASGGETETKFHTATHLLLASLREILGKNVNQKGVNINSERIRFDFNWPQKLTDGQIKQIEDWVNDKISQNLDVKMEEMSFPEALQSGATSIPGFKYPEIVKVFSIGTISKEICGGPHVKSTGEIGKFKIIKEESSSSGVRRIRATIE